jgi:hypothetical protein
MRAGPPHHPKICPLFFRTNCLKVLSSDPAPVQYPPHVKFPGYRAGPAGPEPICV